MRSLRSILLLPLVGFSLMAAVLIALFSFWQGHQLALSEAQARFMGIANVARTSTFPLTKPVLSNIASFTRTDLVAMDSTGTPITSTIELSETDVVQWKSLAGSPDAEPHRIDLQGRSFFAYQFSRDPVSIERDNVQRVAVLFEATQIESNRNRSALWPLLTGLITVFLLSSVGLWLLNGIVQRISKLQKQVESIALGDFKQRIHNVTHDELGRLGESVNSMAEQLQNLWNVMDRQQKLNTLHQLSSGLAHQLRNTLTGARLAIELHAKSCNASKTRNVVDSTESITSENVGTVNMPAPSDVSGDEITMALHQIENAESTIRRLVDVGLGQKQSNQDARLSDCLDNVRMNVGPVAKHLQKEIVWDLDESASMYKIADGSAFVEAITNLLLNAIDAGKSVTVATKISPLHSLAVQVIDDGPGPPDKIRNEIFEPFVTSRPEGLGLGLAQVKLAVDHLKGSVSWRRENDMTIFELTLPLIANR